MKSPDRDNPVPHRLRRFLFFILLLALVGTGAELFLVGHTEDAWQWVPVLLIPLAILLLAWMAAAPTAKLVRAWQGFMFLFLVSGFLGLGLHWKSKLEFKKETDPSLTGMKLFWEAMKPQSPPALAPGIMLQIGLLGLAYAYRHPAAHHSSKERGQHE
jgi:hypothetical protein